MMWPHNVWTYARTVGFGGEGRRVVKNGLKIFSYCGGDCPAVVVCCGRGVLFGGDARDNFDARTDLDTRAARINFDAKRPRCPRSIWRHRLARIFVQVHDRLPHKRPLLFFRVFACPSPPGRCVRNLPRKRPFLSVFSPVAAAFGCLSDPVLFFLGIFAY